MSNSQKIAVITGGASGIGQATSKMFAQKGVHVIILDKNKKMGEETCHLIKGDGGESTFFPVDLANKKEVSKVFETIKNQFHRIDYAVNNAGVAMELVPFTEIDEEKWDFIINSNLTSMFLCLKNEIPLMLEHGGGAIVNISSIAGLKGFAQGGVYAASKGAVTLLSRSLAQEYADKNIRINLLCPGFIDTPMSRSCAADNPNFFEDTVKLTPIKRSGKPEEVAKAIYWLCSDAASYIVGQSIAIDGGYLS